MWSLTFLLLLCSQIRGFTLNSLISPTETMLIGTRHGDESYSKRRERQFPRTTYSPQSISNDLQSRKSLFELRAGGGLAIPGMDPINFFFSEYPFAAAFMVCAMKASAADAVAQKSERMSALEEMEIASFNLRRNFAFLFYGGAYQGMFQEFLYNTVFPVLFGEGGGAVMAVSKVSFDMLVITPFLCLPVAYVIKALVFQETVVDGIGRYLNDVKNNKLLFKYWMIWIPVQSLTFTIIPIHYRITFIALFSFFWLILLSTISSKSNIKSE